MSADGLALSTAIGLWAASCLAVVALYRLRDRRRQVMVAFLGPWRSAERESARAKLRRYWRQWLSLGLQLCLVSLLIVALVEPAVWHRTGSTKHWVILLDTSASMSTEEVEGTRFSIAQRRLVEFIRSLDDSDQVLLCRTDSRTAPLLPWTRDRHELTDVIERQRANAATSDWSRALTTAMSHLAGKSHPQLLIVTDGTRADWSDLNEGSLPAGVAAQAILVGRTRDNLGIVAMAARAVPATPGRAAVLVEIENDDDQGHEVGIELSTPSRLLETKTLTIEAHRRTRHVLTDVAIVGHVMAARLVSPDGKHDALSLDDQAFAVLPTAPRTRVAVACRDNLYLEAAVLSDPWLEPVFVSAQTTFDPRMADAVIYDGCEPTGPLERPALLIDPPATSHRIRRGRSLTNTGFDTWNARSPLLAGLDLFDAQIQTARQLLPEPEDETLANAGKNTIMLRGKRDGQPIVALGFDPRQSDLVLRPTWPILVQRIVQQLLGQERAATEAVRPFDSVSVPADSTASEVALRRTWLGNSSEESLQLTRGLAWSFVPREVGLYTIDTRPHRMYVAANLTSSEETRIAPLRPLRLGGRELRTPDLAPRPRRGPVFVYGALLAAGLLLFEWLSFHRRWTT